MEFIEVAKLFEKLENRSKRLEKILILRDFLKSDFNSGAIVYDIISGNFQREIDKKKLGISIKTIFSVLSFLGKRRETEIEKEFNKLGDIGQVAQNILKVKRQSTLFSKKLKLQDIINALKEISQISGTNSNKKKKEILSNLFLYANNEVEYRFLARLLIDDFRIGVSEGVLKEASVNALFPQIININLVCENCNYINLNLKKCFNCSENLNLKNQKEIVSKKYQLVELGTPKKAVGLQEFDKEFNYDIDLVEFAIRRDNQKYFLSYNNSRELYNSFLKIFEKKYNLINSFSKIIKVLNEDLTNVLNANITVGIPIKSMLGKSTTEVEEAYEVVGMPAFLDFKYDGLRMQIHNDFGEVSLFSRNLDNITLQFPEVIEFIKTNFSEESFVIDSECVGFDFNNMKFLDFQVLSRRIMTKEVKQVSHINVIVKSFDILYLDGKTLIDKTYEKRREILENLFLNRKIKQKINFDINKLKELS